ncbi:hypothetical protein GQX74_005517 [Glossina fuscipes]|nr:hypothetical protein GQX74_005517 [Glossina fuscipes]
MKFNILWSPLGGIIIAIKLPDYTFVYNYLSQKRDNMVAVVAAAAAAAAVSCVNADNEMRCFSIKYCNSLCNLSPKTYYLTVFEVEDVAEGVAKQMKRWQSQLNWSSGTGIHK